MQKELVSFLKKAGNDMVAVEQFVEVGAVAFGLASGFRDVPLGGLQQLHEIFLFKNAACLGKGHDFYGFLL